MSKKGGNRNIPKFGSFLFFRYDKVDVKVTDDKIVRVNEHNLSNLCKIVQCVLKKTFKNSFKIAPIHYAG